MPNGHGIGPAVDPGQFFQAFELVNRLFTNFMASGLVTLIWVGLALAIGIGIFSMLRRNT